MIAQSGPARTVAKSCSSEAPTTANEDARPAWHERFLSLLPDIIRHARRRLRGMAPQAREEALDEVVGLALVAYARLVELEREQLAYASVLAGYAVAQYRIGRRVGLSVNCRDLTSHACRCRHQHTIERLDRFDRESGAWEEAIVEDKGYSPADAAATRLDFGTWLASLGKRNRRLAEKLAEGESTSTVARLFGISRGRVSQLRRQLCASWCLFQGELAPAS